MPQVIRTSAAQQDARDIWLYIAADNLPAADRVIDRIDEAIGMLAANPKLGERLDHYRPGLRRFTVKRYVIYCEAVAGGIQVV